jgi:uncharacterized membrane protein YfcA
MLLYLEPLVAIPLHGAVQLVSNGSRTVVQRRHVRWPLVGRFGLLLLPCAFAGLAVAQSLPPEATRLLIGVFVLIATWRPGWLQLGVGSATPERQLIWAGGGTGFLSTTVGATGPLIAPLFLHFDLTRQGLVGTKAACQTLQHVAKLVVFGVVGFAFAEWIGPLALLGASVVVGTALGSLLLDRVSEAAFRRLYMGILTVIALRLVAGAAWTLLGGG